jgi:mannose-1-phosphate guanylyltransferase
VRVCGARAELSLQYHHQCAAHWAGVQGRGIGQIGNVQHGTLSRRISPHPLKEKHRLTNIGNQELVLIGAQCREYPGENGFARLANTNERV